MHKSWSPKVSLQTLAINYVDSTILVYVYMQMQMLCKLSEHFYPVLMVKNIYMYLLSSYCMYLTMIDPAVKTQSV